MREQQKITKKTKSPSTIALNNKGVKSTKVYKIWNKVLHNCWSCIYIIVSDLSISRYSVYNCRQLNYPPWYLGFTED